MKLDVKRVPNTPYKLVISDRNIVGIFERRDHKEIYIEKKAFSAAHNKIADMFVHAATLVERISNA